MSGVKRLGRCLMMRGKYLRMLVEGRKSTTVRLGRLVPSSRVVTLYSGGRPVARALIRGVVHKRAGELSDLDARRDGFASREELLRELERVYGRRVRGDEYVTIIELEVIGEVGDAPPWARPDFDPRPVAEWGLRRGKELGLSDEEVAILRKVLEVGSIRRAAIELYGSLSKRGKIRRVLRKICRAMASDEPSRAS